MPVQTIYKRKGAYLPHWTQPNGVYSVVFRLADSAAKSQRENWLSERKEILQTAEQSGRDLTACEEMKLHFLHTPKKQKLIDAGTGQCWLKRDDIAQVIADAFHHFDNDRYKLLAWCIMPNHVHIVLKPLGEHTLPQIMHSLKSYTAKEANKILNRLGEFWCVEYYDHLIYNMDDLLHCIDYTWENPEKAGYKKWKWRWKASGF